VRMKTLRLIVSRQGMGMATVRRPLASWLTWVAERGEACGFKGWRRMAGKEC